MNEITPIFFLISLIGGLWGLVRLLRYLAGKHSEYIKTPGQAWIAVAFALYLSFFGLRRIWIPWWVSIVIAFGAFSCLSYILIDCKSVKYLMKIREKNIDEITPQFIVEATNQYILDKDLVSDEWISQCMEQIK